MSIKTKAGQLWTDSVAYVALLAGAGLSIAGNVANVIRTRGEAVDALDIWFAVAFPALVVLMVEVFVSARWRGLGWPMQVLRWLGTISIGGVAMRVSWVHLNELMLSRGQTEDVATFGPLAIDFLAIMATALILAGRRVDRPIGRMVFDHPAPIGPMPMATPMARTMPVATQAEADESAAIMANPSAYLAPSIADEARTWLDTLAETTTGETTAAYPVSPAPMSNAVRPESIPGDAKVYLTAWALADPAIRPTASDRNELLAAECNVSTRTVRRWSTALGAQREIGSNV